MTEKEQKAIEYFKSNLEMTKEMGKDNNTVENLEWCNCKYNCNYGTRNERIRRSKSVK